MLTYFFFAKVDDVLKPWLFQNKFELIHMRDLYGSFTDVQWRLLYKQAYKYAARLFREIFVDTHAGTLYLVDGLSRQNLASSKASYHLVYLFFSRLNPTLGGPRTMAALNRTQFWRGGMTSHFGRSVAWARASPPLTRSRLALRLQDLRMFKRSCIRRRSGAGRRIH